MPVARHRTTNCLVLRQPEARDLLAYQAYCVGDRLQYLGGPYTQIQAFAKVAAMIGHCALRGFGRYVITRDGAPLGHVGPLGAAPGTTDMTWTLWDGSHFP